MPKPSKKDKEEELKSKPKRAWDVYSKDEKEDYVEWMNEISAMRDDRRIRYIEFDDQTQLVAYEENRKADLGYNPPVDDTSDFRVTTGLTREKGTTILSTLVNFNLQPNISAFDKDNTIIAELGAEMEDLVKKSREIEMYDEKRQDIYRELIAQGTVFVEEVYKETRILAKYETSWTPKQKISEFKGDDMPIYNVNGVCEAKLIPGKYVLFSNMNDPELQNNACVALYEELDRSVAESIYGEWDRWEFVPNEVNNENPFKASDNSEAGADYNWNTYKVGKGKVGVTKIFKRFSNEAMIMLNGVMMLPCGFPMTKLSPSGLYPVAKGIGERIQNFAYGKGIPSKTRVDQKMYDTFLRAMVGKAWQSYKPALGNRSGNVLSRDIVNPNQITHGIKQNDIFTILPQQLLSITNGDVSMFELVKQVINEKSVTDSYAGQTVQGSATATEIVNQQKQTMLKLAALIDGVRSLEKRLVLLRIYNIVANWTKSEETPLYNEVVEEINGIQTVTGKKIDDKGAKQKKFKKFTMDTNFKDGKRGMKIAQFIGNDTPIVSPRDQVKMEDDMSEQYSMPVRISYINAEWLMMLEVIWNIEIIVSNKDDDQMQLIMFLDNLARVAKLFGVPVIKQDYALQSVAGKMNVDFDKMFNQSQAGMEAMMKQLQSAQQGGPTTQVNNPAQQIVNSSMPTPLSAAKMS